jgi:large subunit ribosomal protein L19
MLDLSPLNVIYMESTVITSPIDMKARVALGLRSGDTVRVWQKIKEGDKTRLQAFEGLILARKHGDEPGATFTVRKVVDGVGVERIFPLYSPMIDEIEIVRKSAVRRSKLYFVREKAAKEIKRQMRTLRAEKGGRTDVVKAPKKEEEKVEAPAK